jgi:acyl-CoA thioesterase-1
MIMAVSFRFIFFRVRLIFSSALTAALVACGGNGERSQVSPQAPATVAAATPRTPAAPPPQSSPEKDTRPVIAAFGDSLSAGFGLEPGKSYPDDLQRLLDDAGYRYRVVNLGVSGDTTTDGVERLPEALALHPAIVVLEFGANDGLRGLPVAEARKNLASMIEALQKSDSKILLAGMTLPRNYGPEYIHDFELMYVTLTKQYKISRIPFLLDGVGGVAELTQPDGLHPTAEGAQIVARTVMHSLQPLLAK